MTLIPHVEECKGQATLVAVGLHSFSALNMIRIEEPVKQKLKS